MKQQNMKVSERDLVASYRRDLETDLAKEIGLRIFRNYCKECFKRSWKAKEVRVRYFLMVIAHKMLIFSAKLSETL